MDLSRVQSGSTVFMHHVVGDGEMDLPVELQGDVIPLQPDATVGGQPRGSSPSKGDEKSAEPGCFQGSWMVHQVAGLTKKTVSKGWSVVLGSDLLLPEA